MLGSQTKGPLYLVPVYGQTHLHNGSDKMYIE